MRAGGQTLARIATLINSHPRLTGPLVKVLISHYLFDSIEQVKNTKPTKRCQHKTSQWQIKLNAKSDDNSDGISRMTHLFK